MNPSETLVVWGTRNSGYPYIVKEEMGGSDLGLPGLTATRMDEPKTLLAHKALANLGK